MNKAVKAVAKVGLGAIGVCGIFTLGLATSLLALEEILGLEIKNFTDENGDLDESKIGIIKSKLRELKAEGLI